MNAMSVAIMLITHPRVGPSLLATAEGILERPNLAVEVVEVDAASDLEAQSEQVRRRIEVMDEGQGVLILTDLFGSTPSNLASRLAVMPRVRVVAGLSLSMLVNVLHKPTASLRDLAARAIRGGRQGVREPDLPLVRA